MTHTSCVGHMWDVANFAKLSWDNVYRIKIARCESKLLTDGHECGNSRDILANALLFYGRDVRNEMGMLTNLEINLGKGDTLRTIFDETVMVTDVDRWLDVENDDGVRTKLISDILDEIEELRIETREQEAEENEAEDKGNE